MVELAHTAQLDQRTLTAARALLEEAFGDGLSEGDWEHALGGVHALLRDRDELVGHGSVVMRHLLCGGRTLRAGYVEGVAVHASVRRRGHGAAIMRALEGVIRGAYDLGALGASEDGIGLYERLGWRRWNGPLFGLSPAGRVRTAEDDGAVYVLEAGVPLDLDGELTCDWRDGDLW